MHRALCAHPLLRSSGTTPNRRTPTPGCSIGVPDRPTDRPTDRESGHGTGTPFAASAGQRCPRTLARKWAWSPSRSVRPFWRRAGAHLGRSKEHALYVRGWPSDRTVPGQPRPGQSPMRPHTYVYTWPLWSIYLSTGNVLSCMASLVTGSPHGRCPCLRMHTAPSRYIHPSLARPAVRSPFPANLSSRLLRSRPPYVLYVPCRPAEPARRHKTAGLSGRGESTAYMHTVLQLATRWEESVRPSDAVYYTYNY